MQFTIDLHIHDIDEKKIIRALERVERRQTWIVEAIHMLLKEQIDETKIAALTSKLNAEADALNASVEASK